LNPHRLLIEPLGYWIIDSFFEEPPIDVTGSLRHASVVAETAKSNSAYLAGTPRAAILIISIR
jgi:hypothetical protein